MVPLPPFTIAHRRGLSTLRLTSADFNQDGKTDLAVANYGDETLTLLLGDGTGGFVRAGPATPLGKSPNDLAAVDFNGDGTTDLAIPEQGNNNTIILLNHFYQTATATLQNVTLAARPLRGCDLSWEY